MESGKKIYNYERSSLNNIVQNTLDIYDYHLKNKGFKIKVDLDEDIPDIYLDEEAVAECIINILDNSVKYSDKNKFIHIRTGRDMDNVYVSVKDKGIGIASKDMEHIFDKFYRVSDSLIHNNRGSGLGLTLIKHFMEAHKGKIDVKSKIDEGTTITLLFPI
jgi:two-component system phosphate regulon sensor histidine kinase PhoR